MACHMSIRGNDRSFFFETCIDKTHTQPPSICVLRLHSPSQFSYPMHRSTRLISIRQGVAVRKHVARLASFGALETQNLLLPCWLDKIGKSVGIPCRQFVAKHVFHQLVSLRLQNPRLVQCVQQIVELRDQYMEEMKMHCERSQCNICVANSENASALHWIQKKTRCRRSSSDPLRIIVIEKQHKQHVKNLFDLIKNIFVGPDAEYPPCDYDEDVEDDLDEFCQ